jgi:hypothetical protein
MKKKYKLVMKVPKTPKNAYDHGRFISSLIEHQIKHFHEVEKSLLKPGQKLTGISKIKTELQASKYLKKMTALLHPQGAESPRKVAQPGKTRKRAKAAKSKGQGKTKSRWGKRKSR